MKQPAIVWQRCLCSRNGQTLRCKAEKTCLLSLGAFSARWSNRTCAVLTHYLIEHINKKWLFFFKLFTRLTQNEANTVLDCFGSQHFAQQLRTIFHRYYLNSAMKVIPGQNTIHQITNNNLNRCSTYVPVYTERDWVEIAGEWTGKIESWKAQCEAHRYILTLSRLQRD